MRWHEPACLPFALSLSKGPPSSVDRRKKGEGFDKLSPNGWWIALAALTLTVATPAHADRADSLEYVRKAEAALARSRPRDARIELLNAIDEDPAYGPAHLLQAQVYLKLGNGIAAEAEAGKARDAGIPLARTRHLMADAYLLQNAPQRALIEANPAGVPRAFAADAARVRGRALAQLGDAGGAAREFDLAARIAPRSPGLWVDIGRFRLMHGDRGGAVAAANRALALDPRNPDALLLAGELVRTRQGPAAALRWFDGALAIDPNNVAALLARASALGEMGRMRAMLAATRQVLSIEDRNPTAFYLQALLAARAGKYALARALMQRTDGALDDMPAMMLLAGMVEYRLGNVEQSIERLTRLLAIEPDNIRARRILAAAHASAQKGGK